MWGFIVIFVALLLLLTTSGCGTLSALLNDLAPNTHVVLKNDADFDVSVVMYIYDQQEAPRDVITTLGERIEVTVPAGEMTNITRSCHEFQAVVIDDADLLVIGSAGPEANSDVLRDGSDFGCRDVITFTFDHSGAVVDFDVTADVEDR